MIKQMALGAMLLSWSAAWAAEVKIGALVSGQVDAVMVKPGQSVKTGQTLLTIDMRRYQAKLQALQAEVKYRELALQDMKIEYEQTLDLFDRAVIARRPYDRAKLDYDLAQQALQKAQAELEYHQAWSDYFEIKAPVNAKVKSLAVHKGSTVYKENDPLIILETP
jgi:RND family efflux transporter MFP subunit